MDNHIPTLIKPASPADFSGYTLYPDAGDPELRSSELPTPTLPEPDFPTVRPSQPNPPTPSLQPDRASPFHHHADMPATVPVRPVQREKAAVKRESRPVRKVFQALFALFAILVYGGFLLAEGGALLSEGLGKLAVEGFFGQPVQVASTQSETTQGEPEALPQPSVTPESPALPTESSPPAREEPTPPPTAAIADRDLSSREPSGLGLINETPYTPDLAKLAKSAPVIDSYPSLESIYGKNAPAVLILHTHGTEAFQNRAEEGYHTTDKADNICTVGEALAETLTAAGIGVIHCTELFDAESFDLAYYNAAGYIRETLAEHPSIRYILDIHRDAVTMEDGTGIRPLSRQNGEEFAQLMLVVGTDHGGSGHDTWETNLALAARLQSDLHQTNPTLMRDINLRSASFNAQYAPGALLVEAGAACSTLEEAIRSIRVFGEALAAEILGTE